MTYFSRKSSQQILKLAISVKKWKKVQFLFYIRLHFVNCSSLGVFTFVFRLVKMHGGNVYISFICLVNIYWLQDRSEIPTKKCIHTFTNLAASPRILFMKDKSHRAVMVEWISTSNWLLWSIREISLEMYFRLWLRCLCEVPEHNIGTWVQWPLTQLLWQRKKTRHILSMAFSDLIVCENLQYVYTLKIL